MRDPVAFFVARLLERKRRFRPVQADASTATQGGGVLQIQYLGFQSKQRGRDYAYLVTNKQSEQRTFTFSISAEALLEGRVRYQDAASVCYQKLQKALELETVEQPLPRYAKISIQELDEYRELHSPPKRHNQWGLNRPPKRRHSEV
jgi:hypothetical protein